MANRRSRTMLRRGLVFASATIVLAGCGMIRPQTTSSRSRSSDPACAAALTRAHMALASAAADSAPGSHIAYAAHAAAMAEYHTCLTTESSAKR